MNLNHLAVGLAFMVGLTFFASLYGVHPLLLLTFLIVAVGIALKFYVEIHETRSRVSQPQPPPPVPPPAPQPSSLEGGKSTEERIEELLKQNKR